MSTTVNLTLDTATVSREGFGTPIFISSHRSFPERVRTYSTLTGVGEDFGSTSNTYIAASQFFKQETTPAFVKIGRREADGTYAPINVETGNTYSLTVTVNDGDSVFASYTAGAGDTAEVVVDALIAAIAADGDVTAHVTPTKVGTLDDAVLTLPLVGAGDFYYVTDVEGLDESYVSSELPADVVAAIDEEDDDFYFVTAEDHSAAFVSGMRSLIATQDRQYFYSTAEAASITSAYTVAATDIHAVSAGSGDEGTVSFWHQDADTLFPECGFVAMGAPFSPDEQSIAWGNKFVAGISQSLNTAGNKLTETQRKNLSDRNVNYVVNTTAGLRVIGGKSTNGTWIDELRIKDCMSARIREKLDTALYNTQGSKFPGGKEGVALAESAIRGAAQPFVNSKALTSYSIDVSGVTIDTNTRTITGGIVVTGVLKGAIFTIIVNGSLVNEEV